jgi:hypothetical protein
MISKSLRRLLTLLLLTATPAFASEGLDTGDTAWMIVATALVMMMTPAGLALFYGGLARYKNLLNTYAMTFAAYCLASVVWVLWGYSLAFGTDKGGLVGGLEYVMLAGIGVDGLNGTIPQYVFIMFQMTFACITLALVIGSVVDRLRFAAWIVFSVSLGHPGLFAGGHWAWGGGWMAAMGALDFAGGTVVHINAGVAGLVLALVLGKRIGYGKEAMFPSSVALTALGAALLWFGWFGFNAGSQLAADGLAGSAFMVTNTSAAMGALTWMFAKWGADKKPSLLGIGLGGRGRPGGHYTGRRLRGPGGRPGHRCGCRVARVSLRGQAEEKIGLRRFAGCLRRAWHLRDLGGVGHRYFRQSGRQSRRCRFALRQSHAGLDSVCLHYRHRRLFGRGHPGGDRHHARAGRRSENRCRERNCRAGRGFSRRARF